MALQVRSQLQAKLISRVFLPTSNAAVADGDYVPMAGEIVQFNAGDITRTHTIIINDDDECGKDPNENFFSNIALDSGIPEITVTVPRAMVTIDDTAEPECGKHCLFAGGKKNTNMRSL